MAFTGLYMYIYKYIYICIYNNVYLLCLKIAAAWNSELHRHKFVVIYTLYIVYIYYYIYLQYIVKQEHLTFSFNNKTYFDNFVLVFIIFIFKQTFVVAISLFESCFCQSKIIVILIIKIFCAVSLINKLNYKWNLFVMAWHYRFHVSCATIAIFDSIFIEYFW